ncbi:cell division protein FtsB [Breznakia blatticola]|uniref:Cell division protein FtsB n=1 Tax=Breznakia blatticola TaxID=1754012 RepID=A0A4R7ZQH5_9FIRM|nr:septum formation initiator family protein [Breznakia blatticola]TDW20193.1 cell division protein FtsB [Breznakia blatticola]
MAQAKKKRKPSHYVILALLMIASIYCIAQVVKEVQLTLTLRENISGYEEELKTLRQEKAKFEDEKSKLNNEEYVVNYARGKYNLTKGDGEQVFKLPED